MSDLLIGNLKAIQKILEPPMNKNKIDCARTLLEEVISHLEKNELPIPSRRNHAKFAPFLRLQQHSFDNIGKGICATVAARTRHCEWQRPRMRNFLGVRNLVIGYFARLSLSNSVLAGFRDATWVGDGRHPGGSWSRRVRIVGRDARNTVVYIENNNYY